MNHTPRYLLSCIVGLFGFSAALHADAIYNRRQAARPAVSGITIQGLDLKDQKILYRNPGAPNDSTFALGGEVRIMLDDAKATNLNNAEKAFIEEKWDEASKLYGLTETQIRRRELSQPWLKDWVAWRMSQVAQKTGRFDLMVNDYLARLLADPDSVKGTELKVPADGDELDAALVKINAALPRCKSNEQRKAMLSLRLRVEQGKKDDKAAAITLAEIIKLDPLSPAALRAARQKILDEARTQLKAGQFDAAASRITKAADEFVDPDEQADALLLLADISYAKALKSPDNKAMLDAAADYLKVSASFPRTAEAGQALMKVAEIHAQKLGDKDAARKLYQQIASEFKDTPIAKEASSAAQKL